MDVLEEKHPEILDELEQLQRRVAAVVGTPITFNGAPWPETPPARKRRKKKM